MKKINCVIIDDEKEALDRLETLLQKFNNLEIAALVNDSNEATNKILEIKPDLVFIDVEMPRKTGFDIIKEVNKHQLSTDFIFVTGYNQYAIKAIRAAAFDYILKPVDMDDLKETLERFKEKQEAKRKRELPSYLIKEYGLTKREIEIVNLVLQGKTSSEIGDFLFISKHTVDTHRRNICEKTGTKTITELLTLI
jgi:DNA-binding NarL/FixJ family response regulator